MHKPSMVEPPDVCLAVNPTSGLAFRATSDEYEARVINPKWSLPSDVKGTVQLTIGTDEHKLDIAENTNDSISAPMNEDEFKGVLDQVTKASTLMMTVGKDKPVKVALSGSAKVISAFRTCAGLKGDSGGGANPFK